MAGTLGSGRYASMKMNGGYTVEMLGRWELSINFDSADATYFGSVWKRQMPMMQGWTATAEGFLTVTTSTTSNEQQMSLYDAALEGTKIQDLQFHMGPTSSGMFWMPNVSTASASYSTQAGGYVTSLRFGASKDGIDTLAISFVGYGPLGLYKGTSSGTAIVESTSITES